MLAKTPIRVGINARYLNSPLSGIERYIEELLKHTNPLHCVFHPRTVQSFLGHTNTSNRIVKKLRPFYCALWDRHMETFEGRQPAIDVFHAPSFIAPRLYRIPAVVTVHDLAFRIYPEFFDCRTLGYYKLFFEASLSQVARIICVSNTTASDLKTFYPEHQDKVRVVHNGYSDFSRIEPEDNILPLLGLIRNEYLLCVGAFNSRKNIQAVLAQAPKLRKKFPHLKIVVVGRLPEQEHGQFDQAIVFTGHISDAALSSLYRNAVIFVYPSKYEGFGFPLLEAMSVNTPVAFSRASCLPEIAGLSDDHSFDPDSPAEIIDTIVRVIDRGKNCIDESDMRKSLARFSWDRMSKETVEVYQECLR